VSRDAPVEYSRPAWSKPFEAQKSVQTSCVMVELEVEAPSKRRPFWPSIRQVLAAVQPLASVCEVWSAAVALRMMRA